jgi:hypothetical protein
MTALDAVRLSGFVLGETVRFREMQIKCFRHDSMLLCGFSADIAVLTRE